jgi:hypothetical protein
MGLKSNRTACTVKHELNQRSQIFCLVGINFLDGSKPLRSHQLLCSPIGMFDLVVFSVLSP